MIPGRKLRLPLVALAMASLVVGVLAGFARLAIAVPSFAQAQAGGHGALMVCAFFGTVISLERAVALRRAWPYAGPLCAALGGAALLGGAPAWIAPALFLLASLVLVAGSVAVLRLQPSLFAATLASGAALWLVGNGWWASGAGLVEAVPAWIGFLVVTIAGERLELTRLLPRRPGANLFFMAALATTLAGSVWSVATGETRPFALGLMLLAVWLIRFDIARRNVHQRGLTRFVAAALLSGYAWLAVGGFLGVFGAFAPGGAWRDAALHAVLLGFVFSMVIGHAPIVLPSVMQVKLPYSAFFYVPLTVLHLSVLLRVAAGMDAAWPLRQWAASANAAALLLFVATILWSVARAKKIPP